MNKLKGEFANVPLRVPSEDARRMNSVSASTGMPQSVLYRLLIKFGLDAYDAGQLHLRPQQKAKPRGIR